jgi:tight adherence protein B
MVTAINIHNQVGGNLATMLEAVSVTIRDRIRLFAEVRVLTTQQRYTSYILSLLPVFVTSALFFLNPDYIARLFNRELICVPVTAGILVVLGIVISQRMIKIEI